VLTIKKVEREAEGMYKDGGKKKRKGNRKK